MLKGKWRIFWVSEMIMLIVFSIIGYSMYYKLSHKYWNQTADKGTRYIFDLAEYDSRNDYCIRNGLEAYDEKSPDQILENCLEVFRNDANDGGVCEGTYVIAKCYDKNNKVIGEVGSIIQLRFQNVSDDNKVRYVYPEKYFSKEQMQRIYEFQETHFSIDVCRLEGYYEGEEFVVTSMTVKCETGTRTINNKTDRKTVVYDEESDDVAMYGTFLTTQAMKRPVSYHKGYGMHGVFDYLVEKYEASRAKKIQAYNEAQFLERGLGGLPSVSAEWVGRTTGDAHKIELSYKGETYTFVYSYMTDCNYVALAASWFTYIMADIFYFLQAVTIILSIVLYKVYIKRRRLDYSKVVLTNGIAHELKTPLAVIKNYGECIEGHVNPEKDPYYVSSIIGEADRMNDMVVNLLNYTKFSNEEYKIKKELVALDELAIEVLHEKEEAIKQKSLEVSISCNGSMEVLCDGPLIKMVIENYMTNAVRHTPAQNKIDMVIEQKHSWLHDRITCSVYNQGSFMSLEEQSYIWDVFYRGDKARNRKGNSTGFGLAICKHIIKLHKGKYGCKDAPGGVQFYFTIPTGRKKNK